MDAAAWDARYAERELVWSAKSNQFVDEVIAPMPPGTAIDLACGEGRNSIWMAERGWSVTAIDFSQVAIDKGRDVAIARELEINWVCADVVHHELSPSSADLVLICYLQLPQPELDQVIAHARSALVPGGTLVVIEHARANLERGYGGPSDPTVLPTPEQIVHSVGPMRILRAEHVDRHVETDDGPRVAIDLVVVATRDN